MDEAKAKERAMEHVFIDMTRGDIEYECERRGIKVVKSRSTMENKLIDAFTKEYMKAYE